MSELKAGLSVVPDALEAGGLGRELRCAVRFPIVLPLKMRSGAEEFVAHTRNVSANGVLFESERQVSAGVEVSFCLEMPGAVLGTPHDVLVECSGRVVRCCISQGQFLSAATIDEYQFVAQ